MSTQLASEVRTQERRSTRVYVLSALGPATAAAGVIWALLQPYRLTILHPEGQGFWWLLVEPPLLVILVGLLFHLLILPGLVEDIEKER